MGSLSTSYRELKSELSAFCPPWRHQFFINHVEWLGVEQSLLNGRWRTRHVTRTRAIFRSSRDGLRATIHYSYAGLQIRRCFLTVEKGLCVFFIKKMLLVSHYYKGTLFLSVTASKVSYKCFCVSSEWCYLETNRKRPHSSGKKVCFRIFI